MRQLLLRPFIAISLPVIALLLAACGGAAGAVPTDTGTGASNATSVPAMSAPTATNPAALATDTAVAAANTAMPTQAMVETETPGGSTTPPAGIADHVLTNADNNSSVTLKVGDTLLVELRARQWSPPKVDSSILGIAPLTIMVPQGAQAWKYKALATGQTDLTSQGQCPPNPGGVTCKSVLLYKVTVTVMNAGQ